MLTVGEVQSALLQEAHINLMHQSGRPQGRISRVALMKTGRDHPQAGIYEWHKLVQSFLVTFAPPAKKSCDVAVEIQESLSSYRLLAGFLTAADRNDGQLTPVHERH
jgi:hypothetical protein